MKYIGCPHLDNLGEKINGKFADYNPCLTLDENTLFFTSKRTRSELENSPNDESFNPNDGKLYGRQKVL